jgi:D-erythronate 2-dehydrogenase
MRIAITGGAGFLGDRLARRLLAGGSLTLAGATPQPVDELRLIDRVAPRADLVDEERVTVVTGDLAELAQDASLLDGIDLVVHLAAVVSGEAERDFDLGLHVNLDSTRALLEACRAKAVPPRLVFASSLAVFGGTDLLPLPEVVTDSTLPLPQTSYGTQKYVGELLVSDYARRGMVPGRSVRLMTVSVRPGAPNAAASGYLSGIIREPIAGIRSACPVGPETEAALSSPERTLDGIMAAITTSDADWGPLTALTLPALTVTVGQMIEALRRVVGEDAAALVDFEPDPTIAAMVRGWATRIQADRAVALGLTAPPDFDSVIREYLDAL